MGINLPNLISMARLLAVPLAVWLILRGYMEAAFWLFVAAGISDAVDGYLARVLNARTLVGTYLDPIADKALLVCMFVTLGFVERIDIWLVILVVSRDVMIVGGVILAYVLAHPFRADPSFLSKINTTVQIVFIGYILARFGLGWGLVDGTWIVDGLAIATAATTVISGAGYMVDWVRHAAVLDEEE